MSSAEQSLSSVILTAVTNRFPDAPIQRVLDSFTDAVSGRILEAGANTPAHQRAASFIAGLDSAPFHDHTASPAFAWAGYLERNAPAIRAELREAMVGAELELTGNNVWAPPVVEAANAYGPEWRTLVLQDREWDPVNTRLFPVTTRILRDSPVPVPSVEAFFARQSPNTGIKLHTDDCNFILTMHLGLEVPAEQSWIEVGGERRYWEQDKAIIFDTSFYHRTMNESSDLDRIVLLIRFWHPEMSVDERDAMEYLFELIGKGEEHPDVKSALVQLINEGTGLSGKKKKSKNRAKAPPAPKRGFGK